MAVLFKHCVFSGIFNGICLILTDWHVLELHSETPKTAVFVEMRAGRTAAGAWKYASIASRAVRRTTMHYGTLGTSIPRLGNVYISFVLVVSYYLICFTLFSFITPKYIYISACS